MGLYLCVFDGDDEVDGVEVGGYSDFNGLREYITREFEANKSGSRFPTLIMHSDCDGEWTAVECVNLINELADIIALMKGRPPLAFLSDWQRNVARATGLVPQNAFESFIDVDGEFVIERIYRLAGIALQNRLPILFQ